MQIPPRDQGTAATIPYDAGGVPKTSRYQIYALVGRGSSGLVYKALDRVRNLPVALKSLRSMSPEEIYSLKMEFRVLRDIYHPNLAQLLELYVDEDRCYFTMELLEGRDFATAIRGTATAPDAPLDYTLLRAALAQLADGLEALHDHAVLHRDIKPNNVLVEPDGRTVLLDFGLSINQSEHSDLTRSRVLAGTPAYMAPELYQFAKPTTASDWYSVGVMLFETMTGRRPFPDPKVDFSRFAAAQAADPPDPGDLNPSVPDDLRRLVMSLLAANSNDRPDSRAIRGHAELRRQPSADAYAPSLLRWHGDTFVGRQAELGRLLGALARSRAGTFVACCVSGLPGVGKTALIEQFLAAIPDAGALILRSRCHEHEEVRYKALDGVVDSLSHFLKQEQPRSLKDITPTSVLALTKVFPVLARVPFDLPDSFVALSADPHVNLQRAFTALQDLIATIAATRPVVLWIDDLQWTDEASIPHLRNLLGHFAELKSDDRAAVPLVIFSHRDQENAHLVPALVEGFAVEHIPIAPLDLSESKLLYQQLCDGRSNAGQQVPDSLMSQAGGLPIFVRELCHYFGNAGSGDASQAALTFERVLHARLESLPRTHADMLELVAVALRPLAEDLLIGVADREAARHGAIYALCRQRLLRRTLTNGFPTVECFHDQVRRAIVPEERSERRVQCHRRIAAALRVLPRQRYRETHRPSFDAQSVGDHFEMLCEQWLGAGRLDKAARYAAAGAKAAANRLAFDRAAELLQMSLRLRDRGARDWPLRAMYARELANSGRSADAAMEYVGVGQSLRAVAVDSAGSSNALVLAAHQVRAAEQFLYAGLLSDGLRLLREVFLALQLPFPQQGRVARWISYENRLAFLPIMLGLQKFRPRPIDVAAAADKLLRLDTLWVAAKGTVMLDYAVGDVMTSRYLKEALQLGESSRALRAMGLEASVYANIGGPWMVRRSHALMARARQLAQTSADPYDRAMLHICDTTIAWCCGRWRACQEPAKLALQGLAECAGTSFDVAIVQGFALSARAFLGELPALREEVSTLLADARRRGDRYIQNVFESGYLVYLHLADDDPERALRLAAATLDEVPNDRFTSLHLHYFNAYTAAQLYAGNAWQAWNHVVESWPRIENAGFLKLACIGSLLREVRGRVAVAAAAEASADRGTRAGSTGSDRWTAARLLRVAEGDAARISRQSIPHATALAAAIRAGVAAVRQDVPARRRALDAAARCFKEADMAMHAEAARLHLAALDRRADEYSAVIDAMTARGIRDPVKMAGLLIPCRAEGHGWVAGAAMLS